jgi:hypothetical protein
VDSTHGISNHNFELITLLVIDKYQEGIPVAFCIASKVYQKLLHKYFSCIKTQVPNLNVKVFMSDDAPMFYNAWEVVFGPCQKLLCAWHVDRAWKGHLNSIKDEKKKEEIYKVLKTIMFELNENLFNKMLQKFIEELSDDADTQEFNKYFMKYYYGRARMWAYCYRKGSKLNTNMHIESFHRKLKHLYLDGKKTRRLDKCIHELLNLINDEKFDNYIKSHKGKLTKKTTRTFQRHKAAQQLTLPCSKVSENSWKIVSATDETNYEITKIHDCNNDCLITCRLCSCCLSAYKCTCHDNLILNNMCKHIHYIVLQNTPLHYNGPLNKNNEIACTTNNETILPNTKVLIPDFTQQLFLISQKLTSQEHIDPTVAEQVKKHLNAVQHLLEIPVSKKSHDISNLPEPVNKKIVPQKRFYSVKKQKSQKRKHLCNPTEVEKKQKKPILLDDLIISTDSNYDHMYYTNK